VKQSDLVILLHEGEGSMLEYKEALSSSMAREFTAFANTVGGKILLGVRDDGTVIGVADSNALRARIQDLARNCDPPVEIRIEPVGKVIVVHVRESDSKPIQCSDGFFWRQGSTTQKLRREEIRDLFRSEGQIRFDLSLCPRFRYPQDFDREKYTAWLRLSGITGRPRTEDVLVNIEAVERSGGKLVFRNVGALFFARNVRHFFNQAYITCLLAKGADKVHILDRKDFDGGIVADIEDAMRFIERNTRTAYRIERLRRENVPEYPMRALREAITNAVMHRDWFIEGANVFVEIYTDRIEVVSPGGLPKGMTLADLGRKSVRRNALIADLLHRIAFIEKAGTGIKRIRDEVREQGCPEPEFEATGFFTAIFRPNPEVRALSEAQGTGKATGEVTGEVTPQEPRKYRGSTGEVAPQVNPKYTPSRTPSTPQVLRLLQAMKGDVDRQALQRTLRLKALKNFRLVYLRPALSAGLIEMTIPDKPHSSKQRYRITRLGIKTLRAQKTKGGGGK
jgi:ATP-dependent DNA helicase RecG